MLSLVCFLTAQVAKWLNLIYQIAKIIPHIIKLPFDSECLVQCPWVVINIASIGNASRCVSLLIESQTNAVRCIDCTGVVWLAAGQDGGGGSGSSPWCDFCSSCDV